MSMPVLEHRDAGPGLNLSGDEDEMTDQDSNEQYARTLTENLCALEF